MGKTQSAFRKNRGTIYYIFILRLLSEKNIENSTSREKM